jgi:hypothetical protein
LGEVFLEMKYSGKLMQFSQSKYPQQSVLLLLYKNINLINYNLLKIPNLFRSTPPNSLKEARPIEQGEK